MLTNTQATKSQWKRLTTEQKCALVREVWTPRYSARETASLVSRKVGHTVTKGSMIGLQNRHGKTFLKGIRFNGSSHPEDMTPRVRRVPMVPAPRPVEKTKRIWEPTVFAESRFVPLHELAPKECRYAVNNASIGETHLFCGCKTKIGEVYCDGHRGCDRRRSHYRRGFLMTDADSLLEIGRLRAALEKIAKHRKLTMQDAWQNCVDMQEIALKALERKP